MSSERTFVPERSGLSVERILVAGNRGPCGGVNMALDAGTEVLNIRDELVGYPVSAQNLGDIDPKYKVYANWDLVNNGPVMEEYNHRGLIGVKNNWDLVPDGSVVLFSAHGVPPKFWEIARERDFKVVDTTCQLVDLVHRLAIKAANGGSKVAYIGVEGHPETEGVLGELKELGKERDKDFVLLQTPKDARNRRLRDIMGEGEDWVVYSQTTLMPMEVNEVESELGRKFPDVYIPEKLGICYATYNRQKAVEQLIEEGIDLLLVVGSPHSHNSQMLKRRGIRAHVQSHAIDLPKQLRPAWFKDVAIVGATSGASVLERFLDPVIDWVGDRSAQAKLEYQEQAVQERELTFKLPKDQIVQLRGYWAA